MFLLDFCFSSYLESPSVDLDLGYPSQIKVPFVLFETRSICVALAVLMETRLASNTWSSSCLCLPCSGIKDVCHHGSPSFWSLSYQQKPKALSVYILNSYITPYSSIEFCNQMFLLCVWGGVYGGVGVGVYTEARI